MPRRARLVNAMTRGVLDPNLRERIDLEHFYSGIEVGQNVYIIPQGGFRMRGGLRYRKRLRRAVSQLTLDTGQLSAPNGGTVANAIDGDPANKFTTTNAVSGALFVVIKVDFGTAQPVDLIDVQMYDIATTQVAKALKWQWSDDDANWNDWGLAYNVPQGDEYCRRFGLDPEAATVSARYWRMVVDGTLGGAGAFSFGEMLFFKTTNQLPKRRCFSFIFSRGQTYSVALQGRHAEIFKDGIWQAPAFIPFRDELMADLTRAQSRDTMLLFHNDQPVSKLFRQGGDTEWRGCLQEFTNVPDISTETGFLGLRNEIHRVKIDDINDGDTFSLSLGTQPTVEVTKSQDSVAMRAALIAALEGLNALQAGLTLDFAFLDATTCDFLIEYTGGTNAGRHWPLLAVNALSNPNIRVEVQHLQDGRPESGKLMEDSTGWPRCGTFHQQRLVLCGFKLAPDTILMSGVVDPFDFPANETTPSADDRIEVALDSEEVNTIVNVFSGRHLQFFAETSEWWLADRTLDATQPTTIVQSTRFGSKEGIPIVSADGGSMFIQGEGNVLRDYLFSDIEQDYTAEAASLLSSHLLNNVSGLTLRRASRTDEGTLIIPINGDGTAAIMSFLRRQEVIAMTSMLTDGFIFDAAVDGDREIFFITERMNASGSDAFLEQWDETYLLDQSIKGTFETPSDTITGLDHWEGVEVFVFADRAPLGKFTVSGGQVTLPEPISEYELGRMFDPIVTTMPFREQLPDGQQFRPPVRCYETQLSLTNTGSVAITANADAKKDLPGDHRDVALRTFGDDLLDVPMLDALFTGEIIEAALLGSTEDGQITITQDVPGPLQVRSLLMQVSY